MKAIQVTAYGGPEVLACRDVERPEPGAGEVRVKVAYAGVNFIDVYTRNGLYARSQTYANSPPFTNGREGVGTVDAVGPGVAVTAVDPLTLAEAGSLFFTRPHMADYMRDAEEIGWRGGQMFEYAAAGEVRIHLDQVLPLEQAAEAHRILEARETTGKLLLDVS